MSNLEHYFENLLFDGKDCRGDVNKNTLTKEEQEAVEICAQYVIWSIFDGREEFKNFIRQEFEPIKHGRWIDKGWNGDWQFQTDGRGNSWHEWKCSECEFITKGAKWNFCPNCGAKMEAEKE